MIITLEQINDLKTALLMAIGGERDLRVQVRGEKYTINNGDSYIRDPHKAGVYAALSVLEEITPEDAKPDEATYEFDTNALDTLTVPDLREIVEEHGLAVPSGYVSKDALLDIIRHQKSE